jgi:hypothetical protein
MYPRNTEFDFQGKQRLASAHVSLGTSRINRLFYVGQNPVRKKEKNCLKVKMLKKGFRDKNILFLFLEIKI